jgi:glucoamylase
LQIDETGSIIWGMWEHYRLTKDERFLGYVWDSVLKGAQFLNNFIDKETKLPLPTYDLWEERKGEHTYSSAAVYGGLVAAVNIAKYLGKEELAEKWDETAQEIKDGLLTYLWNPHREAFYRSIKKVVSRDEFAYLHNQGHRVSTRADAKGYVTHMVWDDDVIDTSLLGVCVPFEVLDPQHEYVQKTVDAIEKYLSVDGIGGLKRYEHDNYIGGNPWIITTLWMALYRIRNKELDKAKELLKWAVKYKTSLSFLPEQVNKDTGEVAWVVPLTWSHAMFVLVLLELLDEGVTF